MNPSISPLKILLGTLGYLLVTFPLAFVWHLVLFKETYDRLGSYSRKDPIVAFGFGAILLQGIVLSLVYPQLCKGMSMVGGALKFAMIVGGYHWTVHVLAEAAKQSIEPLSLWFSLETTYLIIQFVLAGFLFAWICRDREKPL
jgi:hypothetical protein